MKQDKSHLDQVEELLTDRRIVDVDFYGVDLNEGVCEGFWIETHDGKRVEFTSVSDGEESWIEFTILEDLK
jgi:hypothetical protein